MISNLILKKNDMQPYYRASVVYADGTSPNITGAAIVCTMKNVSTGTVKINRQSTGINITSSSTFEYRWQAGDTDTVGTYKVEFEITPASGGKFTLPGKGETAYVVIEDSLDTQ